jgi:demethylmenaquinone methyltransferase/2-methoxy-6-polyprenyl-1,4-benzoquinol methylase
MNPADDKSRFVRRMFDRIAGRYDLLNRVMTLGQDQSWRRQTVAALGPPLGRVLDLGAGTGDLAFEVMRQSPSSNVVAADFSAGMMQVGRQRPGQPRPHWVLADAQRLPFADASFDGVVSGFLLRNVGDLPLALAEQVRVLTPGGRWASLETTPPARGLLRPLVWLHFRLVIPTLGRLIAGDAQAYQYLPSSTEGFLPPEDLANRLRQAGLQQVSSERLMLGTVAIHRGRRPA